MPLEQVINPRTQMSINTLKRYAELSRKIKELEAMREVIYEEALLELSASGEQNYTFDEGKVSMSTFTKWEYPDSVNQLREDLKSAELESRQYGTAIESKKQILKFTSTR